MNSKSLAVKPASISIVLGFTVVVCLLWFACAKFFGETASIALIVFSMALNWAIVNFPRLPFHTFAVNGYRNLHAYAGEHLTVSLAVVGLVGLIIGQLLGFGVFYGAATVMYIIGEILNINQLSDD